MTEFELDRRKVLTASGAALTVGLAGCLGDDDDGNGDDGNGEDDLDDFLDRAPNWDGNVEDHTGEDQVEVENGGGSPGEFTFDPPAITVDEGTTVQWTWVSSGHSVTHENGNDFDSDVQDDGYEFEHTFDEAGTYTYWCVPHQGHQRGAVIVE